GIVGAVGTIGTFKGGIEAFGTVGIVKAFVAIGTVEAVGTFEIFGTGKAVGIVAEAIGAVGTVGTIGTFCGIKGCEGFTVAVICDPTVDTVCGTGLMLGGLLL